MINKRLGVVIVIISILISVVIFGILSRLGSLSQELGCAPQTAECIRIETFFSISHVAVGIMASLFSLGIYLIFFSKGEEAILKRLEDNKEKNLSEEKFNIILKALDPFEQRVLKAVKEQDGITQNTLRLRANMSKAKLSYVLQELEKRNLVKREKKGKTLAIFLKI